MTIFFAALPGATFALDPNKGIHQYNCQTWSRQHGLASSGINAVAQSSDGYLWLGTSAGLIRFDGIKFTLVPMPQEVQLRTTEVTYLTPRREGGVWATIRYSGFAHYANGNWTFSTEAQNGTRMDVAHLFSSSRNELWIGGDQKEIRSADGKIRPMFGTNQTLDHILYVMEDSRGRVWMAQTTGGLQFLQNGTWHKFRHSSLENTKVSVLAEGLDGHIWMGTDYSLLRFDSNGEFVSASFPGGKVTSLLADRQGMIWAGTWGAGLLRFANGAWSSLLKQDGLADNHVLSIAEDREGSIWIGTRDGLNQLTDVKLPSFGITEGLGAEPALGVSASPRGGLWVTTHLGAWYFNGKEFSESYTTNSPVPVQYVKRVHEDRHGNVYFISGANLIRILKNNQIVASHATSAMPVAMTEDAESVVVSAGGSLYRIGPNRFEPYTFTNNVAPETYWILNLATGRDGAILVASVNGVFRIHNGTFQHWNSNNGLGDNQVRFVWEDEDGTIWAGLSKGISRIRGQKAQFIGREHGLPEASVSAFILDKFGTFWVDANRGVYSVTRQQLNDFLDGKISRVQCTTYDGLGAVKPVGNYAHEQVGCRTPDGRIWFPNARGVIMVDPASIRVNPLPPIVQIESIRADGRDFPLSGSLSIPPGRGELAFRFTGLSFIAPQSILFQYKLEGYDQDWVNAEDNRAAVYANLRPGSYTFRVRAANADGVWDQTGRHVALQLQPHFHQTTGFYLLCGIFALGALIAIYAWRIRHLKQKQAALQRARDELEQEVQKRTAELAAANASLRHEENQLKQRTISLQQEIEHRTRVQREVERVQSELLATSRLAGMAEVATSVLHNVGNVLNSVNVSTTLLHDRIKGSRVSSVGRVAAMINSRLADLGSFITTDPKGQQLPGYLTKLAQNLSEEQTAALEELATLQTNIGHIKDIVAMQQSYAKIAGVTETVKVVDLVEDALRMNEGALVRHAVRCRRDFDSDLPDITVDRHKVIQVLVNLIRNAKYACDDGGTDDKEIVVRVKNENGGIHISVIDNGVGIPAENLTRIFNHGFTTRKEGHGFGLHSGALAAKEMGGALRVFSEGPGQGATFTLELPLHPPKTRTDAMTVVDVSEETIPA